jgi:hypothetical protein
MGTPHQEQQTQVLLKKIPEELEATTHGVSDLITRALEDKNPLPINTAAAKAKFKKPSTDELHRQLQLLDVTLNIFEPIVSKQLPLEGTHPALGLIVEPHPEYKESMIFTYCEPGTISHKRVPLWKSCLWGSRIRMIDNKAVYNALNIVRILLEKQQQWKTQVTIQFAQLLWSATTREGTPTLHFDQMNVFVHHLHVKQCGTTPSLGPQSWMNHWHP